MTGIEPATSCSQNRRATAAPHPERNYHFINVSDFITSLSYLILSKANAAAPIRPASSANLATITGILWP